MASSAPKLNGTIKNFIEEQVMFFVATAAPDGRVNMSPKGLDSLRIIDDCKIIWLNLTGSGNETAAHLLESPRMTLMFCAFSGTSRTLRVYGDAKTTQPEDERWTDLISMFPDLPGARQIFELDIDLVTTSCGSSYPFLEVTSERADVEFVPYWTDKGEEGCREFWQRRNMMSIDGRPTGIK